MDEKTTQNQYADLVWDPKALDDPQRRIDKLIYWMKLDKVCNIDDLIQTCTALINAITQNKEAEVAGRYLKDCQKILQAMNASLKTSTLKTLLEKLSWLKLFKSRIDEVKEHHRVFINNPKLLHFVQHQVFTMDDLLAVAPNRTINILNNHVLAALENKSLTFSQALALSYKERVQLTKSLDEQSTLNSHKCM